MQLTCKALAADLEKALELEKETASQYSPCVVEDEEIIVRQIHSPIHIDDETGEIKNLAFEDAFGQGMSVNRLFYASENEINALGEKKAEIDRQTKPERNYEGYITAKVERIRACVEGDKRLYAVYDTATEQVIYHADLFILILGENKVKTPPLPKKAAKKYRISLLQASFSKLVRPSK